MITVTISDKFLSEGLAAAAAARIGQTPADPQMTAQQWLEWHCEQIARTYGTQFRVSSVSSGDFVLRFSAEEFYAINGAAAGDPIIAGFLARVRESQWVVLDSQEVADGIAYLVAVSLLAADRVPAILAWGAPEPAPPVEPTEPEVTE